MGISGGDVWKTTRSSRKDTLRFISSPSGARLKNHACLEPLKPSQTMPKICLKNVIKHEFWLQRYPSKDLGGRIWRLQNTQPKRLFHGGLVQRLAQRCHLSPSGFRCKGFAPGKATFCGCDPGSSKKLWDELLSFPAARPPPIPRCGIDQTHLRGTWIRGSPVSHGHHGM